MFIESTV